jgi:phospholipid/cholesterol/gamma-HCH transport system permease protein
MRTGSAFEIDRRAGSLRVAGELRMADAGPIWKALCSIDSGTTGQRLDIDLSEASIVDGAIMSLLVELRVELAARGIGCEFVGASARVSPLVHLYRGDEPARPLEREAPVPLFERAGRSAASAASRLFQSLAFVGELASSAFNVVVRPSTGNLRAVPALAERAGADGVPIVLLLNFLVGVVMAYQSSEQLKRYGANVYVADVVGISVTRELAPLMTAIIMSGRSGAAFAAELGTMKVSEELDALRTLGLSPFRYLVVPRLAALLLVAPVLTLLGDVVGVSGGAIVGVTSLDVSAVFASEVWTGLLKSVAFGGAIAIIGCQQGFATTGGAAGVGRRTTATVVICLFSIVILDTLLTIVFRMFDV